MAKVKIVQACYVNNEAKKPGDIVDTPKWGLLVGLRKAVPCSGEAKETTEEPTEVPVSEKVREFAIENGVDLTQVEGTGQGGRITKSDVIRHLDETPSLNER